MTSGYIATLNEGYLANHTTVKKKHQVVSHLSNQPKGKVLFWLLVAEKGLKKPIQSHTCITYQIHQLTAIVFEVLYIIINWP